MPEFKFAPQQYRKFVRRSYERANPAKFSELGGIVAKWTGHEPSLFELVCGKYGLDPHEFIDVAPEDVPPEVVAMPAAAFTKAAGTRTTAMPPTGTLQPTSCVGQLIDYFEHKGPSMAPGGTVIPPAVELTAPGSVLAEVASVEQHFVAKAKYLQEAVDGVRGSRSRS